MKHLTWPADRFYWAMVPGAPWQGRGQLPAGLLALAEDDLPVPGDALHAVGAPVEGGVLVCAVPRGDLEGLDRSVLSLRPAGAPQGAECDCTPLNLLVGAFEPIPIRRARLRRHGLGAGTAMLCLLLVSAGLARRSAQWTAAAEADRAAWMEAATGAVPGAEMSTIMLDLKRRASQLDEAAGVQPPTDAALVLTSLLEHWPAQVSSKPQAITVRGDLVSVSVLVQDAAAFLAAMIPPPGWTMDQPMMNASGDLTRLSLTFHAAEGGAELAATEGEP